jgi:hypothetical protein
VTGFDEEALLGLESDEDRDEREAAEADALREILTGLPARPGTRR